MHRGGLKRFTARKLERWANLGVLPHAKRKGRGRGKGWDYLWPDEAMGGALFIADAFTWQKSRRFEDAVLWAWLRGAPIPVDVVRKYLLQGISRQRSWLDEHLRRQEHRPGDQPLDLVDRLAQILAAKHGTLRSLRVPTRERLRLMQESLAHLVGEKWSEGRKETVELYTRADQTILSPLIGLPWEQLKRHFSPAKDVPSEQRFFSYSQLERLVKSTHEELLLAAREAFARPFYATLAVISRLQAGDRVPAAAKAQAQEIYQIYSIVFQMDPSWVIVLFLKSLMGRRRTQTA